MSSETFERILSQTLTRCFGPLDQLVMAMLDNPAVSQTLTRCFGPLDNITDGGPTDNVSVSNAHAMLWPFRLGVRLHQRQYNRLSQTLTRCFGPLDPPLPSIA